MGFELCLVPVRIELSDQMEREEGSWKAVPCNDHMLVQREDIGRGIQ